MVLQPRPDVLHRLELRGVAWQQFRFHARVARQKLADCSTSMGLQALLHDDDAPFHIPFELLQERHALIATKVAVGEQSEEKPNASTA